MPQRALRALPAALAGVAMLAAFCTHAAVTSYFGEDLAGGSVPSIAPNLEAARGKFLAAAVSFGTESFEGLATGDGFVAGVQPPFTVDFGVATARIEAGFAHVEVWEHALGGRYPTDGSNYLLLVGHPAQSSFVELRFAAPVGGFGFSATDVGDFAESLRVHLTIAGADGILVEVPHTRDSPDANAGALFFGVLADTNAIASVRIENIPISAGTPFVAFDDLIAVRLPGPGGHDAPLPVPEVPMVWLMAAGFALLGTVFGRRKSC